MDEIDVFHLVNKLTKDVFQRSVRKDVIIIVDYREIWRFGRFFDATIGCSGVFSAVYETVDNAFEKSGNKVIIIPLFSRKSFRRYWWPFWHLRLAQKLQLQMYR